jgi:hypothetical protein
VFSAPDYPQFQPVDEPRHNNRASVLRLRPNNPADYEIITFSAVPRPAACPFYDMSAPGSDDEMMLTECAAAASDVSEHGSLSGASDASDFLAASLSDAPNEARSPCSLGPAPGAPERSASEICNQNQSDGWELSNHRAVQGSGVPPVNASEAPAQGLHLHFEIASPGRGRAESAPVESPHAGTQTEAQAVLSKTPLDGCRHPANLLPEPVDCAFRLDGVEAVRSPSKEVLKREPAETQQMQSTLSAADEGVLVPDGRPPHTLLEADERQALAKQSPHEGTTALAPEFAQRCVEAGTGPGASLDSQTDANCEPAKAEVAGGVEEMLPQSLAGGVVASRTEDCPHLSGGDARTGGPLPAEHHSIEEERAWPQQPL